ncbi:short-chain dehydrogenase reductase sdr [Diplodia corticola]|uniref:Short-chain dehydrogenase reductase sdr n=1 Tax=Diplodia corticola TaxID=236234 RepID=A0A1J9SKJ1_9PEZI|nr:short-chain dehydrogenase reductase sdr [Diplodia corticola]OJD40260.1 short-chain dehydrogenase reductase sdr [Diplodia corticola]
MADLDLFKKYSLTKTYHQKVYPDIDPTNPANSAAGKTVAISGGHSGIGFAMARGFCAAGAATVILLARRQAVLDEAASALHAEYGTTVWTYSLDVRDTSAVSSTFSTIRQRLGDGGDVDILIANAAVLDQGETTLDYDPAVIANSFATNVFGNLNLARGFLAPELPAVPKTSLLPGLAPIGGAKDTTSVPPPPARAKVLIEVSTAAAYLLLPGQAVYSTSKLASTHFLRHLQAELDLLPGRPVRVHSFHPGAVLSPGVRDLGVVEGMMPQDDESLPGGFATWLASPAAEFLKGRLVWANWDVGEMVGMKERFEAEADFCTVSFKM